MYFFIFAYNRLTTFPYVKCFLYNYTMTTSTGKTKFLTDKPRGVKRLHTEKEYQKQQELLLALEDVSKVLTVEVDLQKILSDMATIVAKAVGAKWVNFWELTADKKSTYIAAMHGMKQSYVEQSREHPIKLGTAWIGRAIQSGKAWGTSDILTDPYLKKELGPSWETSIKKQDYRALLCVPTISRKGPVGGMCVYYPEVHEFSDFEMRLVTVAANQAATSITNAQIFNDLAAERNKTASIIHSLSDGLIMYDLKDKITLFNPRAEELLWVEGKLLLDAHPSKLSIQKNPLFKNIKDISALSLGEFETREITILEPQRTTLAITNLPVRDFQDKKIGSMRVLHNITKEKEVEQLKSSFISVASHQLRTPLSGIKWALAMLESKELGPLTEKQTDLIAKTYQINNRLIGLVGDLLDVARIEEERFGYTFKKVSLSSIVAEVLKDLDVKIQTSKRASVVFKKPRKKLPSISADKKKLSMAVSNIIDNAVKYTPKGTVTISFYAGTSSVIMEVEDTGIGIPEDQKKFVFTKFFRARNAVRLQTEGSGLGLWIANEIIKRHNGKILVESEENKGSVFSLQIPTTPETMPKGKIKGL